MDRRLTRGGRDAEQTGPHPAESGPSNPYIYPRDFREDGYGFDDGDPPSPGGMETARLHQFRSSRPSGGMQDFTQVSSSDATSSASATSQQVIGPQEAYVARQQFWDELEDSAISVQDMESIVQKLMKTEEGGMKRSFVDGRPSADVIEDAPVLKVGLSFLAGSHEAKVTKAEQVDMMKETRKPEQMSAEWRVQTAGTLLREFNVREDLTVVSKDHSAQAVKNAKNRLRGRLLLSSAPKGQPESKLDSTAIVRQGQFHAVTIDSDLVTIVHDVHNYRGQFDLECTLVEVDGPSLGNLIVRYRKLIEGRGPPSNMDQTRELLEVMMEDVRRLCHRSPILFRMTTRSRIIKSKSTRYGVNNGQMFTTLTTSRGIQEMISHSASYFNTMDKDPEAQSFIRPRFLQMVVLLLSLLNDEDCEEIREFLETTYKFKADRRNLELLILKVLPLRSINGKVFLTSLIPAFEGYQPRKKPVSAEDFQKMWDSFILQIQRQGYILPATVHSLGRKSLSWIVNWPVDGFKDTKIFSHLQYFSEQLHMFNKIPRFDSFETIYNNDDSKELTVELTNEEKFIIKATDYEGIIRLTPNIYALQDARENGRIHELEITEEWLNEINRDAIQEMNAVIRQVNAFLGPLKKPKGVKFIKWSAPALDLLGEVPYSGRLTRHAAIFGQSPLAIAYKQDGQKINLRDAVKTMAVDCKAVSNVIEYYLNGLQKMSGRFEEQSCKALIRQLHHIQKMMARSEICRNELKSSPSMIDEPITRVIISDGDGSIETPPFFSYESSALQSRARPEQRDGRLLVKSARSTVAGIIWHSDNRTAEVRLISHTRKYLVSPIRTVTDDERSDELRLDDTVLLLGEYMVVVEPYTSQVLSESRASMYCQNFLKITNIEEQHQSVRGMLRRQEESSQVGGQDAHVETILL